MKHKLVRCIGGTAMICLLAAGQTLPANKSSIKPRQQPDATTPQQLLTRRLEVMIRSKTPLTALRIPLLNRMGDGAATNLIDIIKARGPLTQAEQRNVIDMVHISFEEPAAIMHHPDRTPVSSLILLDQIDRAVSDPGIRDHLAETRQFVMDASGSKPTSK